ncbi:MAG TPA: tRNA (5-methylaminomethyl-2-thiouridine)(34)-methyltransferase MnmD [Caulobacteraceae bacterium]|nr:tRNA (5-methylaminomethyl-2-thiouridine)(34)-methyltransferase MnmD [Caulobacteraceae bacterium]
MPREPSSPLVWGEDGLPRSSLYGDVYFSSDDGLAESRAVFLQGCGLPGAWAGRRRFVVGELGFGTGLNIAALLELWRREGPPGAQLHIFSIEAHPLSAEEARRALSRWPEVDEAAEALTGRWPGRAWGIHRVELPGFNAILDLAVMDAAEALAGWDGKADAWFLDGFSPALNPQMWSEALLALVAARSNPGARAATFTVAGAVRRGLEAAGFAAEKRPGFGRKRERLEARLPGTFSEPATPSVGILGAGIAGASLARAFRALGAEARVQGAADGASRNPAALVTPRLDAGLGAPARLYSESFRRAVALYQDAVIARGARQLETGPRDARRYAAIAASDLFEPGSMVADDGLFMADAIVVDSEAILSAWLGELVEAGPSEVMCIAAGHRSAEFVDVPLQPIRGQASWAAGVSIGEAVAFGGYAIPTRTGVLFGATHDRDVTETDVREADNARNLALLAQGLPDLAARLEGEALEARASIRAATPDKLPVAGEIAEGRYVLSGLGSRGFCTAPLLAEHVAAKVLGAPSPLLLPLSKIVDPRRFAARDNRRSAAKRGR